MAADHDVLVIGAGAAGSATAILLARAGWRVAMAEQHAYPRRKVCGECIAAGNLPLLDEIGIGAAFRASAGPPLARVGWMDGAGTIIADMPACQGPYPFGRVLGRDRLDSLLLQRATSEGVTVLQPARVRSVRGAPGAFECALLLAARENRTLTLRVPVVVDAHGSWERDPLETRHTPPHRNSDLLAFKATFRNTALEPGLLPVLALPGAYGGMVVGDDDRTTLACCIRRDALARCRARLPGTSAGAAVERFLIDSCPGIRAALDGSRREGGWLSVGPLRPGIRLGRFRGVFRVGNAAGESHPLIGEGISMALQAAVLLAAQLGPHRAASLTTERAALAHARYAAAWRQAFGARLRLAALYAHIAMRPTLAVPARQLLKGWPALLGEGARLAGKARPAAISSFITAETA
jgi:2-polyprenyl-6-methoxyphenol hydroxylase-like FAD-dependent oxidoreductase